jgi:hypothetical protein
MWLHARQAPPRVTDELFNPLVQPLDQATKWYTDRADFGSIQREDLRGVAARRTGGFAHTVS